jgi:hypothetical protein
MSRLFVLIGEALRIESSRLRIIFFIVVDSHDRNEDLRSFLDDDILVRNLVVFDALPVGEGCRRMQSEGF